MILKKTIMEGKEVFAPVDRQEAKELMQKGTKLVFTDEDEQEELEDEIEEELEEKEEAEEAAREAAEEAKEAAREAAEEAEEAAREAAEADEEAKEDGPIHEIPNFANFGHNIQRMVDRQLRHALHRPTHRHFYQDTSTNPNSKMGRLLKVLPFMSRDDLHELVEDLLKDDESLATTNIVAFLPFLSQEDCDMLFMRVLKDGNRQFDPIEIAPFVSAKSLSIVVDEYLKGQFQETAMDELYPFLSPNDVKRVFKHIMTQKKED